MTWAVSSKLSVSAAWLAELTPRSFVYFDIPANVSAHDLY